MKKSMLILLGSFLFFFHDTNAKLTKYTPVIVSIPKCGTHMTKRLLLMMTDIKRDLYMNHNKFVVPAKEFELNCIYFGHRWPWENELNFFSQNPNVRGFLVLRDPRDYLLSHYYWTTSRKEGYLDHLTFDEAFTQLIIDATFRVPGSHFNTSEVSLSLEERYRSYLRWAELPNFCLIRFEDLVGPKGGGSLEVQLATIKKIAHHLEINITDEHCLEIANQLYGHGYTFNPETKGRIGRWEAEYTLEMKQFFDKHFSSDFLLELGYKPTVKK